MYVADLISTIQELRLLALEYDLLEDYWTLVELEKYIAAEAHIYH
jgi:hypothetical protein